MKIAEINGNKTRMFEDEFDKGRRTFRKIAEDERWYIFEVDLHDETPKEENLEVILKRITPKSSLDSHTEYTHIEKYPSDEQWGIFGWTATNIEYAYRIIHRINMERGWEETSLGAKHTPLKDVKREPLHNYEGTEKLSPHIKSWSMYN